MRNESRGRGEARGAGWAQGCACWSGRAAFLALGTRGRQTVAHRAEPTRATSRHPQRAPSSRGCATCDPSAAETAAPAWGDPSSAQKPKVSANLTPSRAGPGGVGTHSKGSGPDSASSYTSNALRSLLA